MDKKDIDLTQIWLLNWSNDAGEELLAFAYSCAVRSAEGEQSQE